MTIKHGPIQGQMVSTLLDQSIGGTIALIPVFGVNYYIFKDFIPSETLIAWLCVGLLSTLFRLSITILGKTRKVKSEVLSGNSAEAFENLFALGTLVITLVIGFQNFYFFEKVSNIHQTFLIVQTAGFCAGGSFIYAASLKSSILTNVFILSPLLVALSLTEENILQFVGLLGFIFLLMLNYGTYVFYKVIKRSISLSMEKDELLKGLSQSNQLLEEQHQELIENQKKVVHTSRLAAVGEMSGGIAHEINNPLTVILNYAKKLERQIEKGDLEKDNLKKSVEKIQSTATRIEKIVKSLKTFSRENEEETNELIATQTIIQQTLDLCSERFKNHGMAIRLNIPEESLLIRCNSIQISQVILNLLNNAIDAMEENGGQWVEITLSEEQNSTHLKISNDGPKIPENIADKIFQPFYTTKEVGKGTGLGLSLSKGIIEEHGGEIFLEEEQPYTCFHIILPSQNISVSQAKEDSMQ